MATSDETLGGRLKRLRLEGLGQQLGQRQIAVAVSSKDRALSVSLISSWENDKAVPSQDYLIRYAWVFATKRSLNGSSVRPLPSGQMTPDEQAVNRELLQELTGLRKATVSPATADEAGALGGQLWHFADGRDVCIVVSKLPPDRLENVPYAQAEHPNHIAMLAYADIDALIEIFGHIRAENPGVKVSFRTADMVEQDDLNQHVVVLGGDWNGIAEWYGRRLELPIEVCIDPGGDDELDHYYRISYADDPREVRPGFMRGPGTAALEYDIGLFVRGPNPANLQSTLTWCQGIFSRGTYGSVRMFSDAAYRQINEQEITDLSEDFGGAQLEWLMFRVPVLRNFTLTPDLSRSHLRIAHGVAMPEPDEVVHRVTWLEGAPAAKTERAEGFAGARGSAGGIDGGQ